MGTGNESTNKSRWIKIGIAAWLAFALFMVWAIFFPSQAFLQSMASRARSTTIVYVKGLESGILLAERINMTRFSTSRIVYLQDDGTMHSRYFNRPKYIRGVSGHLVWTTAPNGLSLELPKLEGGPMMNDVLETCGVQPVAVEIDSLGFLLATREDGETVRCNPGFGAGVAPFASDDPTVFGSLPARLTSGNRASHLMFNGDTASGRLLQAKFAETGTGRGGMRNLSINGEPLVEFHKSLNPGSPRYLGRYASNGKRWETSLGNGKSAITLVHSYHLRGNRVIVLGYNKKGRSCATAINLQEGVVNWSMLIR